MFDLEGGGLFEAIVSVTAYVKSALGKAHKWEQMIRHQGYTPDKIAKENDHSKSYVCSILRLNLLSPQIMEDILSGHQPEHLKTKDLRAPFPYDWELQVQHFSY